MTSKMSTSSCRKAAISPAKRSVIIAVASVSASGLAVNVGTVTVTGTVAVTSVSVANASLTVAQGAAGSTNWVVNAAQGAVGTAAWLVAGPVTVTGTANVVLSTGANVIGTVVQGTAGTVSSAWPVMIVDPSSPFQGAQVSFSNNGLNVNVLTTPANQTVQVAAVDTSTVVGTIASAAATLSLTLVQQCAGAISISGTYAGIQFVVEQAATAAVWAPVMVVDSLNKPWNTVTVPDNSTTHYTFALSGHSVAVRVRAVAWTSGTANVKIASWVLPLRPTTILLGDASSNAIAGITASGNLTAILATNTAVIGALSANQSVTLAATGTVVLATAAATIGAVTIATGAAVIGALTANQSVTIAATANVVVGTQNATIGQVVLATGGATTIIGVEPKDTARTYVCITFVSVTGVTTEALATLQINKGGTVTSGTAYTVTTAKTCRLQSIQVGGRLTSTTESLIRATVRSGATVTVGSAALVAIDTGSMETGTLIANSAFLPASMAFPDGLEIAASQQIGISHLEARPRPSRPLRSWDTSISSGPCRDEPV